MSARKEVMTYEQLQLFPTEPEPAPHLSPLERLIEEEDHYYHSSYLSVDPYAVGFRDGYLSATRRAIFILEREKK
jgi:hypothetical protein